MDRKPNREVTFPTRAEARAFTRGVAWVNDSTIEVLGVRENPNGTYAAQFHDEDARDDEKEND